MTDMICRKSMTPCQTPGMCSPFGGCPATEQVSSVWLAQLRSEYLVFGQQAKELKAENVRLRGLLAESPSVAGELSFVLEGLGFTGMPLARVAQYMTTLAELVGETAMFVRMTNNSIVFADAGAHPKDKETAV